MTNKFQPGKTYDEETHQWIEIPPAVPAPVQAPAQTKPAPTSVTKED